MKKLSIYRKRLIPEECVLLKNDSVLYFDEKLLLTKWNALTERPDFHHGISCYFLGFGFKVSKFYRKDNSLLYWYCDIIKSDYNATTQELVVTDLLADVIILPNGSVQVVDLDELADAFKQNLITAEDLNSALLSLNSLLRTIYDNKLETLCSQLLERESTHKDLP